MGSLLSLADIILSIAIIAVPAYFLHRLTVKKTQGTMWAFLTIVFDIGLAVVIFLYLVIWLLGESPGQHARLWVQAILTPNETITYACGNNLQLITYKKQVVVPGNKLELGTEAKLEAASSVELRRGKKALPFTYFIDSDLPLHLDIQQGYLLGNYPNYGQAFGEADSRTSTLEVLVDAQSVNDSDMASLANCVKNNEKKISESMAVSLPNTRIRGVYAVRSRESNYIEKFACADSESISVDTASNGWVGTQRGNVARIVVRSDGTIAPSSFATEEERQRVNAEDLSTCKNASGTAITEFYKERAGRLKTL